jgi:hypothetical protein
VLDDGQRGGRVERPGRQIRQAVREHALDQCHSGQRCGLDQLRVDAYAARTGQAEQRAIARADVEDAGHGRQLR